MLVEIECPLCRARRPQPWAEERGFKTVRCGDCKLLYVSPRPADEHIDDAVQMGVHTDGLNVVGHRIPAKVEHYRRLITPMFPDLQDRRFSWLDVGAGFGEVVEAVQATWPQAEAFGLEPMKAKADAAQARGLDIRNEYLESGKHKVDVVSANDVFSHIPDFRAFLETVTASLKPGGSFFMVTGNLADLDHRDEFPGILGLPDHLVFAGEAQITRYLTEAGFTIRTIERERFDTFVQTAKVVVKKALGRDVRLALPYSSRYRSLAIRADLE
jgi:SAM-dependent methyltransferase